MYVLCKAGSVGVLLLIEESHVVDDRFLSLKRHV